MKKLLSVLLAITMLASIMVVPASAETTDDNVLKLIEFTPECDKVKYGSQFDLKSAEFTTDKVRVGNYSAHYVGNGSAVKYFQYIVTVQYDGILDDAEHLKMWVYNAGDACSLQYKPKTSAGSAIKSVVELNQGWNLVDILLGNQSYPTFNNVYDNILLDAIVNNAYANDGKSFDLYFGEPWIEKTDTYNTLTATPSVEDGAEDVSAQLDEYIINFSNPLNNPEKAAAAVTLKQGGNEVNGTVITAGADYVKIVPGRLFPETTYTVSIADEALFDITGNEPQTKTFTFTTAEAGETIIPILTVDSPANGSTATSPTKITIGVENGSHITGVKVFDNNNELGESGIDAVTADGSEWQVDAATFTAGEHTITAKAYGLNGEEIATAESTFTVVEVGPFNVSGIYEGAYHALNEKATVKVTTQATSNDIAKVVFVDGETEVTDAEAPFEWTLPNINPGAHELKVYVHDIYGGVKLAKTINYTTFMGNPIATGSQDFEGAEPTIDSDDATKLEIVDCANLDGKALKVTGKVEVTRINPGTTRIDWNSDIKVIYQEFDMYHPTVTGQTILKFGPSTSTQKHGTESVVASDMVGERTRIRIIYDIASKKYSVYQGDKIISEGKDFDNGMQLWTGNANWAKENFSYTLALRNFTEERPGYLDNFKTVAYSELDMTNPVTPILTIDSPEDQSAILSPAQITIGVENGSYVAGIKIFDGDTELGEAVKGADNKWHMDDVNFDAGLYCITAKAYNAYGDYIATAESAFEVIVAGPFDVSGTYNGAYHALNEKTTVRVTTQAVANDIEEVEFVVDGATAATDAEAPFEWNLPNTNPGAHELKVYVHDIYGGETLVETINYTTFMGNPIATTSQDFEGVAPAITTNIPEDEYEITYYDGCGSKALKTTAEGSGGYIHVNPGMQLAWNKDIKVIYHEFDMYVADANGNTYLQFGYPDYLHGHGQVTLNRTGVGGSYARIRIIFDIPNKKYSVYQGDDIIAEGEAFLNTMIYWRDADNYRKDFAYAIKVNHLNDENPVYFDNFRSVAYSDLAAGEVAAAWNNATIIENNQAASIPTSMAVVNNTGSTLNLINVFAEYNPMEVLVNAYVVAFDAPTGQKTESEYVMTDLTAGNTVKMFTLDAETLKPYIVPSK